MKFILIPLFVAIVLLTSCGVKESCEVNHTGEICVSNYSGRITEVYVNDVFAFTLANDASNCVAKPVGEYSVRFISLADERIIPVTVTECETNNLTVSF
ncbi:MAG: hypothetical protein KBB11_00935 [Bacteroidales bacterium]|nr:hypothetical protein [Bacteroidales bacterium]HOY38043.1 hypothetical protein [Bacteroidales bacterium]